MFKTPVISASLAACLLSACAIAPEPVAVSPASVPAAPGRLVVVGGGLQRGQGDIYRAFIDTRPQTGLVLIVPLASPEPIRAATHIGQALQAQGLTAEDVKLLPLAAVDDPSTPEDESLWVENVDDARYAAIVAGASAIWFTGGDQARITGALVGEDGEETAILKAVRQAHQRGAILAGSSAGATVMGENMILTGRSLPSLHPAPDDVHAISLAPGLGFFPHGMIDQHFSERARLGRLAAALLESGAEPAVGYGLDENTALIADPDGSVTVAGTGYVTIVDARRARRTLINGAVKIEGLSISLLSQGDMFDPQTFSITPAPYKTGTIGEEYTDIPREQSAGVSTPPETLAAIIGEGLVDTSGVARTSRFGLAEDGRGVRYTFTQTTDTNGYWGRAPDRGGRYTVERVEMRIDPVRVSIAPLESDSP